METNSQQKNSTISKTIFSLIGVFVLFIAWIIISAVKDNEFIYPSFVSIFKGIGQMLATKSFWINLGWSLIRIIISLVVSLLLSMIISFLYCLKKETIYLFKPLMIILKAAPLAIVSVYLWISLTSNIAPYFITLLMILPISVQGFITAIDNIDSKLIMQLKTEKVNIFKKYFKIFIPLIAPYITMTILQTFGMGLKVMLMGEYICQTTNSLGNMIYLFKSNLEFNKLLGFLIIIVIVVSLIELFIHLISKKLDKTK